MCFQSFLKASIKKTFKWHTYTASGKFLRGYSTDVLLFSLFFPQFYCTNSVLWDVILEASQYVLFEFCFGSPRQHTAGIWLPPAIAFSD